MVTVSVVGLLLAWMVLRWLRGPDEPERWELHHEGEGEVEDPPFVPETSAADLTEVWKSVNRRFTVSNLPEGGYESGRHRRRSRS